MSATDATEIAGKPVTFRDYLQAGRFRGPGFDTVRLLAASIVVVHHCLDVQYDKVKVDILYRFSGGYTHFGFVAVAVFFAISGFLVTPGLERSGSVTNFLIKRTLRIYPALAVVVLVITFCIGPWITTLNPGVYFSDPATYLYLKNLVPLTIDTLPGVVIKGHPTVVDGALWTLYYEVLCYLALVALSMLGAIRHRRRMLALAIAVYAANCYLSYAPPPHALPGRLIEFVHLFVYFGLGATLCLYAGSIPVSRAGVLVALVVAPAGLATGLGPFVLPPAVVYLANAFGVAASFLRGVISRDISYGVYLIHCPVLVILILWAPPPAIWWIYCAVVFAATVPLAILLSICVEQPALRLKVVAIAKVAGWTSRFRWGAADV